MPCPPPRDWVGVPGCRGTSSLVPSDRRSGGGHAIGRNTDAQERRRERGAAGIDGVERAQRGPAERATARLFPLLGRRSEEHTSELQSLMRISYAVFCLKKKKKTTVEQKATQTTMNTRTNSNTLTHHTSEY